MPANRVRLSGAPLRKANALDINGTLSWWSPPIAAQSGYGYAAQELLRALNAEKIRTEYNTTNPKVHISFVQPPWYQGSEGQFRIGYSPWESTKIEDGWVYYMNNMDEIWTPANFCKRVFEDNGITKPIVVIPHGVNPEHYPIRYNHQLGDTFTFLHVGGPTERKGGQRVFDAFLDLFDGDHRFHLLMKSTGPSEARYREPKFHRLHNVSFHPQVTVNELPATEAEMTDIYDQADCLVYPSRGEGFGFIPFQGIASGIPTICSNGTAMEDFAELSLPLDCDWTDGYGVHLGRWLDPSPSHLRQQMKAAVDNWEVEKKRVISAAENIHSTQTWGHVARQIIEHLGEKLD